MRETVVAGRSFVRRHGRSKETSMLSSRHIISLEACLPMEVVPLMILVFFARACLWRIRRGSDGRRWILEINGDGD
jgi:hypothetical protein